VEENGITYIEVY